MKKPLNQRSLLEGVRELVRREECFARIVSAYGPPPLWERAPGFHTLIHIILEQQVSLASAQAAYNRLQAALHRLTPGNFLRLSDAELKQIGFSRQKTSYGRALAHALLDGTLDLSGLNNREIPDAKAHLIQVKGIGPWTADIYLLMALGYPDIWPQGDLALALAIQHLKGWSKRPTQEELWEMSDTWQPWRAVAARLLWHYYLSERK